MNTQSKTKAAAHVVAISCAFCRGTGKDPFGLLSPLSTCQVCKGSGQRLLMAPVIRCAFCGGAGVHPFSRMTCTTCSGVGSVTAPVNALTCPGCSGSGKESDHEFVDSVLSCTACKGKGMIAANGVVQ